MDQLERLQADFDEIRADVPTASLEDQPVFVGELEQLELELVEIEDVAATILLKEMHQFRLRLTEHVVVGPQKRAVERLAAEAAP